MGFPKEAKDERSPMTPGSTDRTPVCNPLPPDGGIGVRRLQLGVVAEHERLVVPDELIKPGVPEHALRYLIPAAIPFGM